MRAITQPGSVLTISWLAVSFVTCGLLVASVYVVHKQHKLPDPPLYTLAERHSVQLGNFAIATHIHTEPYQKILTSQFNMALIDNTPNWYFTDGGLRPSPSTYNFKQMDEIVQFAEANNMELQAHHLVWGEEKWLPGWLKKQTDTPAQLEDILRQHIATVVGRYKGRIQQWTVVNEAFTRQQHIYGLRDWWADSTQSNTTYIDTAFLAARAADPKATLILNDFNNEIYNDTSNAMFDYIKSAKERGIPIDGIGMQMHIDGTHPPKKDDVISNMRRFKSIRVDTYVTEFDVNMADVATNPHDKERIEGQIYYEMMRSCIESKVCKSFAILGITDSETWYNYMGFSGDAMPLPFDDAYRPKLAFYELRRALLEP